MPRIADSTPLYACVLEIGLTSKPQEVQKSGAPSWAGAPVYPVTPCGANQTVAWQYAEQQFIGVSGYPNFDLDEYNGAENLLWGP